MHCCSRREVKVARQALLGMIKKRIHLLVRMLLMYIVVRATQQQQRPCPAEPPAIMQTTAPGDGDTDALNEYGLWMRVDTTRKRRINIRIAIEATGVAAVVALVCWVIALSVRLKDAQQLVSFSPECMHALGGGPVGPGGSLHPLTPDNCVQQLHIYAHTAYGREVELAAQNAMDMFGFTTNSLHQGKQALAGASSGYNWQWAPTFQQKLPRILLSILGPISQQMEPHTHMIYGKTLAHAQLGAPRHCVAGNRADVSSCTTAPSGTLPTSSKPGTARRLANNQQKKKLIVFDIDETLLSNMPQILDPVTWPWDKWVTAAQAEALQPMLTFYQEVCSHGYAIALVTGRREPSRNSTMTNLERAGYGKPCINNSKSAGRGRSDTVTTSGRGSSLMGDALSCCYDALIMRPDNDARLASVYKPWARKQLLTVGKYELVALVGDQYSDLNGEGVDEQVQAYKLPNPFYFIL